MLKLWLMEAVFVKLLLFFWFFQGNREGKAQGTGITGSSERDSQGGQAVVVNKWALGLCRKTA